MPTVIVSREARKDLVGIHEYVSEELNNPDAALRILRALRKSIDALNSMPERGTSLDAILPVHTEYRFIVCEKYCIFYLCDENNVEVVRILHQLQDYMSALFLR